MKTLLLYPPARPSETYDIPDEVTEIETFAFRTAQNITSLSIPSGVSTIGRQAFREMKICKMLHLKNRQRLVVLKKAFSCIATY